MSLTKFFQLVYDAQDEVILVTILIIFSACMILSFQTKFIQIRGFFYMLRLLKEGLFHKHDPKVDKNHILPIQSLFTAMSTSIGIGNIVGPIIAIKLGGPGAVLGFILAMFFGPASTFTEVYLALSSRDESKGVVHGGPMLYLKKYFSPFWAYLYAVSSFILLICWCSSQSNTLGDLLGSYGVPSYASGSALTVVVLFILMGGIKRIAEFASSVVPWMFLLYSLLCSFVILKNYDQIIPSISMIFNGLTQDYGTLKVGSSFMVTLLAFRWGLAKGFQTNESGLGTSSIPHSMAGGTSPFNQAILAMAGAFSNGILCLLTSMTVLVTGAWKVENLGIGINILGNVFYENFSFVGSLLLLVCSTLFVVTTVLGNAYNGSQAFGFVTKDKGFNFYYLLVGLSVFFGSMMDAQVAWTYIDYFLIPLAVPHVIGLILIIRKSKEFRERIKEL
jgi:alanine or glycine:cation symporter, AGCS family